MLFSFSESPEISDYPVRRRKDDSLQEARILRIFRQCATMKTL